jgi:gluconolactonase
VKFNFKKPQVLISASLLCLLCSCQSLSTSTSELISPTSKWREVSKAGLVFAEGVVADKTGKIYATDLTRTFIMKDNNPGGTIYQYDPSTGQTIKFMEPSGMANGLHVDKHGDLLIAQGDDTGGRALLRKNLSTGELKTLVKTYQGKRLNGVNDITSDAQGRIYFTDARYAPGSEAFELPNAVYRLDTNGQMTALDTGIFRPNGIEVSPNGKKLYISVTNFTRLPINPLGPQVDRFGISAGGVVMFDLSPAGEISNGKLIYKDDELAADGMTMDVSGNLYVASHNGNPKEPKSRIVVLSAQGEMLQVIATPPGSLSTNLGFGRGPQSNRLFMSSALPWKIYELQTNRTGHYFN